MKKILLIYLLLSLCLFSQKNLEKEIIKLIEKNKNFECNPTRKKFKVVREDITGYVDENDKPYGEWKNRDESIRECFLDDVRIQYVEGEYFYKSNNNFTLLIKDLENKKEKYVEFNFKNTSMINPHYFKYKNGKYKKIKLDWLHYRIVRSLTDKFIYKYEKIEEK